MPDCIETMNIVQSEVGESTPLPYREEEGCKILIMLVVVEMVDILNRTDLCRLVWNAAAAAAAAEVLMAAKELFSTRRKTLNRLIIHEVQCVTGSQLLQQAEQASQKLLRSIHIETT